MFMQNKTPNQTAMYFGSSVPIKPISSMGSLRTIGRNTGMIKSTIPTQALFLTNNPFVHERARVAAEKILKELEARLQAPDDADVVVAWLTNQQGEYLQATGTSF